MAELVGPKTTEAWKSEILEAFNLIILTRQP